MTRTRRRLCAGLLRAAAVLPVLALLVAGGAATRVVPAIGGCAQAAALHHAALVVEHGNGAVVKICVSFSEDSVTGEQLLADAQNQTGLEFRTEPYDGSGDAVCQIDYEPTSYPASCLAPGGPYWAISVSRGGGSWGYSSLGISSQTFHDGDAEGFRYEGQSDNSVPPSPQGVCPVTVTPTPTPARATTRAAVTTATPPPRTPTPASVAVSAAPTATASSAVAGTAANNRPPSAVTRSGPTPSQLRVVSVGMSAGAWLAAVLGAALVVGLVLQLIRAVRRRSALGPPQ